MDKHKQKILPGRYQVVPRTLIFIRNDDEILLIKGAKDKKIWPGLYNGIGGHLERGEDPLSAAHRELFEETGLKNIQLFLRESPCHNPNTPRFPTSLRGNQGDSK